ncbi:MAG: hypothetical protein ABSB35_00270 [Bryobacteraceae bacterium]
MDASSVASKADLASEELRELAVEVRDLQRRVSALEQREPKPVTAAPPVEIPQLHVSSDAVSVIGRALLAIAGAYLLRALTEVHVLPSKAGVAVGILYAGFWLWRATQAEGTFAATANALSSVFIFAPLIWEATVRLQAVSTWTAAGVIVAFSLAAIWKTRVAMWSCSAGAAIASALLIGTHDLLPFTIALLAIAAGAEYATLATRWFIALCADAAILILITMLGRVSGLPEGYAPVSLAAALAMLALLLLVFIGSAAVSTLIRGRTFTVYEIGQMGCAFALATGGALHLTKATTPVGLIALVAGAACYAIALKTRASSRNTQTYATFAGLLVIAATSLLFSGVPLVAVWSALAIGLSWTAFANAQVPAFLWLAAAISGVAAISASQLLAATTGSFPSRAALIILIAAAVCYFRIPRSGGRVPALFVVAVFVWSASGLGASLGVGAVVLVLFAVALAWSGERWQRPELVWLMYVLMTVAAGKIVVRDFSRESTMTLVVSLLFYGAALILLPRILKRR